MATIKSFLQVKKGTTGAPPKQTAVLFGWLIFLAFERDPVTEKKTRVRGSSMLIHRLTPLFS